MLKADFIILLSLCLVATRKTSMAQDSSKYSSLAFHYAYQIPQGDLKDRFLNSSSLGVTYQYSSSKKWLWSFSGNFMFRDTIRENSILDGLKTSSGYIIDGN